MPYQLFDFSSDVGIEGTGRDAGEAFVGLAQALAHVLTDGSRIEASHEREIEVSGNGEAGAAVAFVNELIFSFDADGFLAAGGRLRVEKGTHKVTVAGTLRGETFDASRHRAGRGAKAATFHEARVERAGAGVRARLVIDL